MLDEKLLIELGNLKDIEVKNVGPYIVQFQYLTLGHILDYQKELKALPAQGESPINFLTQAGPLIKKVIKIQKGDASVLINDLPVTIAVSLVSEWVDLNFTQMKMMIEPLEKMLSQMAGKPVSLRKLMESFSGVLSAAGTVEEETKSLDSPSVKLSS
jgi:hypothetical protein